MNPRIKSGEKVLLAPVVDGKIKFPGRPDKELQKGDVVLVKVAGSIYLHLISAIEGDRVQISNNHGRVNGWTTKHKIYGYACQK